MSEAPSITVLTAQDLLHIFNYLDYEGLWNCRLVCSQWNDLICDVSKLRGKFCFRLCLDEGVAVDPSQSPLSIVRESPFDVVKLTITETFLESGESHYVVEGNRDRLNAFWEIMKPKQLEETVTELVLYALDNFPRTSALLYNFLLKLKSVKKLEFTMSAFVLGLDRIYGRDGCPVLTLPNIENVKIVQSDFQKLTLRDFNNLLMVCPNIIRIDIDQGENLIISEDILMRFGYLIKSIGRLDPDMYEEIFNANSMELEELSYECRPDDRLGLEEYLATQSNLTKINLRMFGLEHSEEFFTGDYSEMSSLTLSIKKQYDIMRQEDSVRMFNILSHTPNLEELALKYLFHSFEHSFGHKRPNLELLEKLVVAGFNMICSYCYRTMLQTAANVTTLSLMPAGEGFTINHVKDIAKYCSNLEHLSIFRDESADPFDTFRGWPFMPLLKSLTLNKVGHIAQQDLEILKQKCPLLEEIKLFSVHGQSEQIISTIFRLYPNIKRLTVRGGTVRGQHTFKCITGKVGWRLRLLDVSAPVEYQSMLRIFSTCTMLELVKCNYGSLKVTRRNYHEIGNLGFYELGEIEKPLLSRQRLQLHPNDSSDSETSDSEISIENDESDSDDPVENL